MAVDLVTVHENTSALHDEYIAHRIGLIPLRSMNTKAFQYSFDCEECEDFCPNCSVSYIINVQAPSTSAVINVTSHDLRVANAEEYEHCHEVTPIHTSGDEDVEDRRDDDRSAPPESGILIARLTGGQKIHMTALARKGLGKDHAKWSPMCTVAYRIVPPAVELVLDKLNNVLTIDARKDLQLFSQGLLKMDEHGKLEYETPFLKGRIAITPDTTRYVGGLVTSAGGKPSDVIRHNPIPERFEFTAETTGAVPPDEALAISLELILERIGNLEAHL